MVTWLALSIASNLHCIFRLDCANSAHSRGTTFVTFGAKKNTSYAGDHFLSRPQDDKSVQSSGIEESLVKRQMMAFKRAFIYY